MPLPSGYSDACLWKNPSAKLVLKASLATSLTLGQLNDIRTWVDFTQAQGFHLLPQLIPTSNFQAGYEYQNRVWFLMSEMPGEPDLSKATMATGVQQIAEQLARLHAIWKSRFETCGPFPGVRRRMKILSTAEEIFSTFGQMIPHSTRSVSEDVRSWLIRLYLFLPSLVPVAVRQLESLQRLTVPIQPCLCDCWYRNFLFEDTQLTGLIDLDAMKLDHPSVDLARILGSLFPDHPAKWSEFFSYYQNGPGAPLVDPEWVRKLDFSGTVCAGLYWMRRLLLDNPSSGHSEQVHSKIEEILRRLSRPLISFGDPII